MIHPRNKVRCPHCHKNFSLAYEDAWDREILEVLGGGKEFLTCTHDPRGCGCVVDITRDMLKSYYPKKDPPEIKTQW